MKTKGYPGMIYENIDNTANPVRQPGQIGGPTDEQQEAIDINMARAFAGIHIAKIRMRHALKRVGILVDEKHERSDLLLDDAYGCFDHSSRNELDVWALGVKNGFDEAKRRAS